VRTLARQAVVAASQTTELLTGLQVNADRMAETVNHARDALLAERASISGGDAGAPSDYLGATDLVIDAALARARSTKEQP
jgi:3-carboxy-cis,cis-muconate cycloisomerase